MQIIYKNTHKLKKSPIYRGFLKQKNASQKQEMSSPFLELEKIIKIIKQK